jgi:hypothetical protein
MPHLGAAFLFTDHSLIKRLAHQAGIRDFHFPAENGTLELMAK